MRLAVRCPQCSARFDVPATQAGRKVRCGRADCQAVFRIPEAQPEADEVEEIAPTPVRRSKPVSRTAPASARRRPSLTKSARKKSSTNSWIARGTVLGLGAVLVLGGLGYLMSGHRSATSTTDSNSLVAAEPAGPDLIARDAVPFIQTYCVDCHTGEESEAGVRLDHLASLQDLPQNRKTWMQVLDAVDSSLMPPPDSDQPALDMRHAFLETLDRQIYEVDCAKGPDPGRVTVRRLNRTEYNNTVRDLLGVNFRPADDFPSDDVGYGFDNIGDVLSLPPLLLEKYMAAAEKIAAESIMVLDPEHPKRKVFADNEMVKSPVVHGSGGGWVLVSNGDLGVDFDAPYTGEYRIGVDASGQRGGPDLPKMSFKLDSETIETVEVKAGRKNAQEIVKKVVLTKGRHRLAVAFLNDFYDEKKKEDRNLYIDKFWVEGPLAVAPENLPVMHRQLVAHQPTKELSVAEAAKKNLEGFLPRVFRRTVQNFEIQPYAGLVEVVTADTGSFEEGMRAGLTAALVSPHFLFRWELDSNPNDAKTQRNLNSYELASRLSYFLWSSMPDEELFKLAAQNQLGDDAVLDAQIRRMLQDPKSRALVDNFAEQWLQLRILQEITPDPEVFPNFNEELRADMMEETKRMFAAVVQEDRSLLDLLTGRYTYVNERLAKHYGMEGVTGNEFQKVSLEGTDRVGVLTHASVLTMTSNPNRTSPVKRGKWIMEVVLDQSPPPAPPNVPELSETTKAQPDATFRQQLELHRADPACASCHRVMDQLGFGMENFDAIGQFRTTENNKPLDSSGALPNGDSFSGSQQLAATLAKRVDRFAETVTERMLTYGLGRGLEYYDRCTTERIVKRLAANDYRFSILISEIVKSEPFRLRRGEN